MTRNLRPWLAGCIVLLSALLAVASPAAERTRLALRLQEGQTYKSRFVSDQTIKQTIQGQLINMTQTVGFVYSFDVERRHPDSSVSCRVRYESVIYKQDGPAGKTDYDSTNPPETLPSQVKTFAALVGQGFTLRISSTGHVMEVRGIDELLDQVIMAVDVPNDNVRETIRKQLKEQFGDEAIRQQMEHMLAIYPELPVVVGDSWHRHVAISTGFPLALENTYTLRSRSDGTALIDIESKLSKNPSGNAMKVGQMTLDYNISGTQEGQMWMSEATGWIERSELKQKFSGTVTVTGAPGMTEAMTWPISAEATVRIESPK